MVARVAVHARGEALEANRSETTRLKGEIADADKFIGNLTRLLADPDIEAGAKKAIARQLAEHEGKREELRQALEAVAVQAALDKDDLMADCRQAFLEAKANFSGLMTPAQVNRFIAEVVGPMTVLPDGRVVQKETAAIDEVAAAGIEGTGHFAKCLAQVSSVGPLNRSPPIGGDRLGGPDTSVPAMRRKGRSMTDRTGAGQISELGGGSVSRASWQQIGRGCGIIARRSSSCMSSIDMGASSCVSDLRSLVR